MNKTKKHEPLVHIAKRDSLPAYKAWAIRATAILAALIVAGIITMLLTGENPLFNIGMTVVIALVIMVIGVFVWNKGIKAYESAGS